MVDVAKALARPATHTLKYFGCELGAQTKFDDKSGQCIVNGAHTADTLANHLEGYIKRFVQCHSCGNPETVINISKRETIHLKCKACGHVSATWTCGTSCARSSSRTRRRRTRLRARRTSSCAARRRSARRRAPRSISKRRRRRSRLKEERRRRRREKEKRGEEGEEEQEDGGDDDEERGRRGGLARLRLRVRARVRVRGGGRRRRRPVVHGHLRRRHGCARAKEQLTDASAAMVTVADDLEKKAKLEEAASGEAAARSIEVLRPRKRRTNASPSSAASPAKHDARGDGGVPRRRQARRRQAELGMHFLVEAIFDEDEPLAPQIAAKKAYLIEARVARTTRSSRRPRSAPLSSSTSRRRRRTTSRNSSPCSRRSTTSDVVEEEAILKWGADPKSARKFGVDAKTGAAVRKQAKPFVEWLEQSTTTTTTGDITLRNPARRDEREESREREDELEKTTRRKSPRRPRRARRATRY